MTMRLDIVTNDAGELVRREHARELGAGVVVAVYRLAKLVQLHDLGNQAFVRQLEQTHQIIGEYCLRAGANVNVLFAHKAVFIAGQLLKGSRGTYESATELAEIMEWCGGSELSIARDITQSELLSFAEAISAALRGEKGRPFKSPTPKIKLRAVGDAARSRGIDVEKLGLEQRVVRTYATAVVVLRRFFDDLAASKYVLPRRIKRVAQNLVDLSAGNTPAFLGVTEVRNANHDAAGRAVNSAILAVSMAREISDDRATLVQIAMAAMMHDVGRPRAVALATAGGPRISQLTARLSEDSEDKLPHGTAAVLTALGRVNEPSITRTVIAFEALWLRRASSLGPVYRGARNATLHARIVTIARRYNDLLTPDPGLTPPTAEATVAQIDSELAEPADRTVLRMLVAALRLFPVGTVVQLSSGETGEVIAGGHVPGRPRVRVAMDARGGVLATPEEIDLARAGESRAIARVLGVDGWKKGLDPSRAARTTQEPSSPSRSAVVPTEPRVPVAQVSSPASLPPMRAREPSRPEAMPAPVPGATKAPPAASKAPPAASKAPPAASKSAPAASKTAAPPPGASKPAPAASKTAAPPAATIKERATSATVNLPPDEDSVQSGTTPSQVAEAMGRMIEEALRGVPAKNARAGATSKPPKGKAATEAPKVEGAQTLAEIKAAKPVAAPPEPGEPNAPTARGTLGATPLAHVLVYMLDHALTGSIVFREPDDLAHILHFQLGAVSKVQIARPSSRIGDELVAAGLVSRATINEAVDGARRLGVLLGEYLVGHDLVARGALSKALEAQIAARVAAIVNLQPETTYSFYRDVDLLSSLESEGVVSDPLNVILATVRAWHDRARIRATLARIAKHPLVFHTQSDPSNLELTADERRVIDHVREARPATSVLFQARMADEEVVSSLLYALAVTRQFAFKGQKGAPMGGHGAAIPISIAPPAPSESMPVHAPPASRAPDFSDDEFADDPGRESALPPEPPSMSTDSPGRPAPRTWQPPAAVSERPAPFGVDRSASEVTNAERALEAMTHFRLAESALQRSDLPQAERLAARAMASDPEQVDYAALHTWIRATAAGDEDAAIEGIQTLTRLLLQESDNERVLLHRGKLLKRVGRMREALRDLERVAHLNPRNREAANEIRAIKQRVAK
jgi:HD-GYP domain-containing protein (c-di-GMP phosphodiesterase class II)